MPYRNRKYALNIYFLILPAYAHAIYGNFYKTESNIFNIINYKFNI